MSRRPTVTPKLNVPLPIQREQPDRVQNLQSLNPKSSPITSNAWTGNRGNLAGAFQQRSHTGVGVAHAAVPQLNPWTGNRGNPAGALHQTAHTVVGVDPAAVPQLNPATVGRGNPTCPLQQGANTGVGVAQQGASLQNAVCDRISEPQKTVVLPPNPAAAARHEASAPPVPEGFDTCPSLEELKAAANRTRRNLTGRDTFPPWRCPNCKTMNNQSVCKLTTLPPLECTTCGEQNNIEFDFNITRMKLHGVDLSTPVLDQKTEGKCSLYATVGCANMSHRIKGAEAKIGDFQQLCKDSLEEGYAHLAGCEYKKEEIGQRGQHRSRRMFKALKKGVDFKTSAPKGTCRDKFKAKKIWIVSKSNFNHICQLLANGYPMVSSIVGGKKLGNYIPDTIYKAPSLSKAENRATGYVSHAVIICGGGACPSASGTKMKRYLRVRNSFSEKWGVGGEGKIRASDLIRDPIGMTL